MTDTTLQLSVNEAAELNYLFDAGSDAEPGQTNGLAAKVRATRELHRIDLSRPDARQLLAIVERGEELKREMIRNNEYRGRLAIETLGWKLRDAAESGPRLQFASRVIDRL